MNTPSSERTQQLHDSDDDHDDQSNQSRSRNMTVVINQVIEPVREPTYENFFRLQSDLSRMKANGREVERNSLLTPDVIQLIETIFEIKGIWNENDPD